MEFPALCAQRGLAAPDVAATAPALAELVLRDLRYAIPVFAAFPDLALPIAAHWIETTSGALDAPPNEPPAGADAGVFSALSALSTLVGLLPSLTTLTEHFVATHAPVLRSDARAVPALCRLLVHDHARYAPYLRADALRELAGQAATPAERADALVALALLMERSERQLDAWLAEYTGEDSEALQFGAVFAAARASSEDRQLFRLAEHSSDAEPSDDVEATAAASVTDVTKGSKSNFIARLGGVYVPRLGRGADLPVVATPGFAMNERRFARALLRDQPLLVVGPPGSGKTTLVEHVHRRVRGSALVRVHLGDQTDAKALVGTYTTGATPGTFEWTPGALTAAAQRGQWVLVEDIDRAPSEIVSVLLSLLTRRELVVPARNEVVRAAPGFQIVATSHAGGAEIIGARSFAVVNVEAPSDADLVELVSAPRPFLKPSAPMLVDVFRQVQDLAQGHGAGAAGAASGGRSPTTRDLVRLAGRLTPQYDADDTFREAVACFGAHLPDVLPLARAIGDVMGVGASQVEPLVARYAPQLRVGDEVLRIGRAAVPRRAVASAAAARAADASLAKARFALTAPTLRLMEEVALAVQHSEPVLLVGETGTGKTTVVQHLAKAARRRLVAINVSQQVETGDLVGGFRPVDARQLAAPLLDEFWELFDATFSRAKNHQFVTAAERVVAKQQWKNLVKLLREAVKMAAPAKAASPAKRGGDAGDAKRPRPNSEWTEFAARIDAFETRLAGVAAAAHFQFIEGLLVRAMRSGHWVLLDEINLAPADTVEGLSELLSGRKLTLLEAGGEVVAAHPEFRLFANMNPATDVGKRDLPGAVRAQFTEVWAPSPDADRSALLSIVARYLPAGTESAVANDVAELYVAARDAAAAHQLADGAGQRPHFSIRTLSRMLSAAAALAGRYGLRRALYEAFAMTFLTLLDAASAALLGAKADALLLDKLPNKRSVLAQVPADPSTPAQKYVQFQHWWMPATQTPPAPSNYIITPSVERNLLNLVRATALKTYPVLIQGPTSSGKTSMITHLAKLTGHTVVRINNHEHTELAEYLGGYESDGDGRLVFREGALVTALRQGHWLVLDELNLAPTDVLEALNRLLDDNRELLVPETQETVTPHPDFVLFATQNPPGIYAGRKVLSRAFRNRFLELHFGDIPEAELEQIVRERSGIAPSYAAKIVEVYRELARQRIQRVFEQAATLRDLFRWAQRPAIGYEELAFNGYALLGERSRTPQEKAAVLAVIEQVMRVKVDTDVAARASAAAMAAAPGIVWTKAMRRVLALVEMAAAHHEPVLLVGETGSGKTTIVQAVAAARGQALVTLNAHQNTETGDLVGSQRPVRHGGAKQLFEWVDGPLVAALRDGSLFLLDEISLADDSVLERLNSVLEPERTLFVPEIGTITAADAFEFCATMNPGGDYGKKELSPALRNRFTEIWVPTVEDEEDLKLIVSSRLADPAPTDVIVAFAQWFASEFHLVSLRDILSWVEFVNATSSAAGANVTQLVVQGALMVLVDGLGVRAMAVGREQVERMRKRALAKLADLAGPAAMAGLDDATVATSPNGATTIGGFALPSSPASPATPGAFSLGAPTTALNAMRVARAMQVRKPVLLEGSPGAGKTSLVAALARLCGAELTRINLSDQTDLADLFGQDVPLEEPGKFGWRSAPFLRAMQRGGWVLLDEMNLAPQPLLEGLNAALDHRGEAYIPELDRTFAKSPDFVVFAAQNPHGQGGGRKGLPKSFVNRFSVVYVDQLGLHDLHAISAATHPHVDAAVREKLSVFMEELAAWTAKPMTGGPFEFNLRDTLRWLDLAGNGAPQNFFGLVVEQRLRTAEDRETARAMFRRHFPAPLTTTVNPVDIGPHHVRFGGVKVARTSAWLVHERLGVLPAQAAVLESALQCVKQAWPIILVGPSGSGKSSVVKLLAQLCGAKLREFSMTADIDSTDLLGEYDQLERESERQQMWAAVDDEVVPQLDAVADAVLRDAVALRDLAAVEALLAERRHAFPRSVAAIAKFTATDFSKPMFKWVDGMLVKAVEQGDWIVLDNANLTSAAVLDRLNSLLERDGSLAVNECAAADGSPREVKPHPQFRLFLTVDPKYGELSRAMRNRGVELFLGAEAGSPRGIAKDLPLQFSRPLAVAQLDQLKERTWLRAAAVDHRTTHVGLVDAELAQFAQSAYFPKPAGSTAADLGAWLSALQSGWLQNALAAEVDAAAARAREGSSPASLLDVSALHRVKDSVESEFDVCGLLETALLMQTFDAALFGVLLELGRTADPSTVPVYRDWLLAYSAEHGLAAFGSAVRRMLGRQYDFGDGGRGMAAIWQAEGRPRGFATQNAHDAATAVRELCAQFDALVAPFGLAAVAAVGQIREVLSSAASVDEPITAAVEAFQASAPQTHKPVLLSDAFRSLWHALGLVHALYPSAELWRALADLTQLAQLPTADLRALAGPGLGVPNVVVPQSLEQTLVDVLQAHQQGQAVEETRYLLHTIVKFGRAVTLSMQPQELVDAVTKRAAAALSSIVGETVAASSPLALARALLRQYVCPLPLDPAIAQHVAYARFRRLQRELAADAACWDDMQRVLGSDATAVDAWLAERSLSEAPVPSIWRPATSAVALVHRDMLAAATLVANADAARSPDEVALLLRNADHLAARLGRATGYRDLVGPVLAALALLRLHLTLSPPQPSQGLLDPVRVASGSADLAAAAPNYPLLVLDALRCAPQLDLGVLAKVVESVHQTWTMDRLKLEEARREQNAGVKYIDDEDDEAEAEREFRAMFPDFDELPTAPAPQDTFVQDFVARYERVFDNEGAQAQTLAPTLVEAAAKLTSAPSSNAAHLPALLLALDARSQVSTTPSTQLNFYVDPSPAEAARSFRFAEKVGGRAAAMLAEWPEHDTLLTLARVASELTELPPQAPLAQHLSKVEQLHHNLHEWDRFAPKAAKVSELMADASALVVRWRQLELATWPALFGVEKAKAAAAAAPFWFHLYESLVFAPVADLTQLAKVLVLYMQAPVGQFERRLRLLAAFQRHLEALGRADVVRVVRNIRQYFSQFVPGIRQRLADVEAGLRKKIDEVVALASWRDVNIHALKQSAQRSHRQLFKWVRKFREQLHQTALAVPPEVADMFGAGASVAALDDVDWVQHVHVPSALWTQRPARLRNLGQTASQISEYAAQITTGGETSLHAFAADVVSQANRLRSETPKTWTKETKKDITALKVEKQQLLTFALRELKRAGLRQALSRTTLDTQLELTQVLAETANLGGTPFDAADDAFFALVELVPRLRAAVSESQSDVPAADQQRGLAMAEDLLATVRALRATAVKHVVPDLAELEALATKPVAVVYDAGATLSDAQAVVSGVGAFMDDVVELVRGVTGATLANPLHALSVPGGLASRTDAAAQWFDQAEAAITQFTAQLDTTPAGPLLGAVAQSLGAELASRRTQLRSVAPQTAETADAAVVRASNAVLVVVQNVVKLVPEAEDDDAEDADNAKWFKDSVAVATKMLAALHGARVAELFADAQTAVFALSQSDARTAGGLAASLLVLAAGYRRVADAVTRRFALLLQSATSANLTLAKMLLGLATTGFCSPEPVEDGDDDDEKTGDGAGLGDGQGGESTSKDVDEDDDDVSEAMQSANPEQEDRDETGEDNAKEMEGDMAGETEDAPPQDDDEDDAASGDDELDDEIGELDDLDPNAVDEKMWDERPDDGKEKQADDVDGQTEDGPQPDAKEPEAKETDESKDAKDGDEGDDGDDDGDGEEEDMQDDAVGENQEMDDGTEQKDALELPEDMQLDGDKDEKAGDDEMDEDMDMDDDMDDEMDVDKPDDKPEQGADDGEDVEGEAEGEAEGEPEDAEPEEGEDEGEGEGDQQVADEDDAEANAEDAEAEAKDEPDPIDAPDDAQADAQAEADQEGDGEGANAAVEGLAGPSDQDAPQPEAASTTDAQTAQRGSGGAEDSADAEANVGSGGSSGADGSDAQDAADAQQLEQSLQTLGDAMQEYHRRQQQLHQREEREALETAAPAESDEALRGDEQLEHVGADDAFDTQALGRAEQQQALDDAMAIDDDTAAETQDVAGDADENAEAAGGGGDAAGESDNEMDVEPSLVGATNVADVEVDAEDEDDEEVVERPVEDVLERKDDLWTHYSAKTHDLALVLGEQLRLILEPTVASKLRGDYRTGKRLNMKRIIPYIASEFRKDKIWLRRSKPARRDYQILLSLDDSRSMGEPAVVDLAFQAIALVGKALSSIEAGQVGIARFGSATQIVHALDRPLTPAAGNAALAQFGFRQERTDVAQLLASSLAMFAELGAPSGDQWRLHVVISDGIADNVAQMRRLVRQAYDERVMVVFVVLDALNMDASVLDMNEVRYTTDADGNMKLEVVKYFDEFPFDYYVIVRDIGDLPLVLANVLRQYFQAQAN